MKPLTLVQMLTHDYDWFCKINGKPVCVSTAGDIIPASVNYDGNVVKTRYRVNHIDETCEYRINTNYLNNNIANVGLEYVEDINSPFREIFRPRNIQFSDEIPLKVQYYCEYFVRMAKKGFYVFDRNTIKANSYHLVAWPTVSNLDVLDKKIFRDDKGVFFSTEAIDFERPETLVDIDLLHILAPNI